MIITRFSDNDGVRIHLFRKIINLYFVRHKNYLDGEVIFFISKNYYVHLLFEWFPSVRELFQFDLTLNRFRLSLFGIKLGINFDKVDSVSKNYYAEDDYIQFHIDSGAIKIKDDEKQDVDDEDNKKQKPIILKEYFVSKYLKIHNEDSLNHKFDLIVELNLFKTYPLKVNLGQPFFDDREWLGCHIDINFRKFPPNILFQFWLLKRELAFSANKKVEPSYKFSFEESYPDQINEHGFLFQKLDLQSMKQINPDDVMIVATTSMGGMGFSGTSRLFVLENNEIKLYFIEISSNKVVDEAKRIFPPIANMYPETYGFSKDYYDGWRNIGMGAGNKLTVRRELFEDVKRELVGNETQNSRVYIYKHWCLVANQTLRNILKRKGKI